MARSAQVRCRIGLARSGRPPGDYDSLVTTGLRLEVAHAVLYVHDVEQMIEFYSNTLGFEVTDRGPLGSSRDRVPLAERRTIITRWRSSPGATSRTRRTT